MPRILVTGGAGFIGSRLVEKLVSKDNDVIIYDNMTCGNKPFIDSIIKEEKCTFIQGDIRDLDTLRSAMGGCEIVFHLAANPDARIGANNRRIDLENGTLATHNVLEAMLSENVKKIAYASSSTVYGESNPNPVVEEGQTLPISLYGASKSASEGVISAYCNMFSMQSWIFRFANVVGKRCSHGVIVDFVNKLRKDSARLEILGNGRQSKGYLLVEDCIEAMLFAMNNSSEKVNIFNIASRGTVSVKEIAEIVSQTMGLAPEFVFAGGERGWPGDVPRIELSPKKLENLGWKARLDSKQAIEKTVQILCNEKMHTISKSRMTHSKEIL